MPTRDQSGPEGFGPLTGRGMGDCAEYNSPSTAGRYYRYWRFGRRFFGRRGYLRRGMRFMRRGFRRGPYR